MWAFRGCDFVMCYLSGSGSFLTFIDNARNQKKKKLSARAAKLTSGFILGFWGHGFQKLALVSEKKHKKGGNKKEKRSLCYSATKVTRIYRFNRW